MSFLAFDKPNIAVGDTIIVFVNVRTLYVQVVKPGDVFQTKFGALKHDEIIGQPYGHKYQCARGYLYILRATPELWTLALPHRTQILYFADISLITSQLDLKPGSVVIEAGTGSGSLTHSLSRTVAPHGHVHTFDFHEFRVNEAREEFKLHGLGDIISSNQRDVCNDGFPSELDGKADALFLDLPHPWEAIAAAKKALKPKGSRLCCFSPCVEQVQKTSAAMRENRFIEVTTVECVQRPYEIKPLTMSLVDTSKRVWVDRHPKDRTGGDSAKQEDDVMDTDKSSVEKEKKPDVGVPAKVEKTYVSVIPIIPIAGHTGFLTFATNYGF